MKKTKFMSIDNTFTFGGAIISLYQMVNGMDKKEIDSVIVSGQKIEYLNEKFPESYCIHYKPKLMWINNERYLKIKKNIIFSRSKIMTKILNIARYMYWLLFITIPESFMLYRIGKINKVDAVHLNNGPEQLSGVIAAKMLRVPCLAHLRGFESSNVYNCFVSRYIDHHIAISQAIKKNLIQLGVPQKKISIIHDAINVEEFSPRISRGNLKKELSIETDQPIYGLCGRIIPWKGIKEFVLAAKIVSDMFPDAVALVVGDVSDGDMEYFNEVKNLVIQNGLEKNVKFTGYSNNMPQMISVMDVVVHASTSPEPFGMVIIEGMAMEKPIVATSAGGPLDIVEEGKTGYLVEMGNPEALAMSIMHLLENPELGKIMGIEGRKRVENFFNHKDYGEKMKLLINNLINNRV